MILDDPRELIGLINLLLCLSAVDDTTVQEIQGYTHELLSREYGLPPDDPLRYHKSGRLLTVPEFDIQLERIIQSWSK